MRRTLYFALLLVGLALATGSRVRYDNYRVYRLQPQTAEQLAVLQAFDGTDENIIYLEAVHHVGASINTLVAPQRVPAFRAQLKAAGISYELLDTNAQSKLEPGGEERIADANRRSDDYGWEDYHELNDTYNWLHSLATQYPETVSVFQAGSSYEGRQVLGIRLTFGNSSNTLKKAIFLEGGMHAREWIGPATTTYIANQLITSKEPNVRQVAEAYDWYIVPHANPDGFVYTHTDNRLWRKTRTPYERCYGADPNRNWDFNWNLVGASDLPCSDTYAGPVPFSEVETRTLADFINTLKGRIVLYVSLHSYSQLLLFPYGHTNELPPNYADLMRVYERTVEAISRRYGTKYTGGNVYDAIYPAAGASQDWAYGKQDVLYSFCYELRPPSYAVWWGFRLPADQIIPTGEETLDGLVEMVKEVAIRRG